MYGWYEVPWQDLKETAVVDSPLLLLGWLVRCSIDRSIVACFLLLFNWQSTKKGEAESCPAGYFFCCYRCIMRAIGP